MSEIIDRLAELRAELTEYSPLGARLEIDLSRPIKALDVGMPDSAVMYVGRATERMLKKLWALYEVPGTPQDKSLNELSKGVRHITAPVPAVSEALTDIQLLRNRGSHDGHEVSYEDGVASLRKLIIILDWYRTHVEALSGGIALDDAILARVDFLSGLYQSLGFRLAKRFDLSEHTCYLLLERVRGLRIDYVELVLGTSVDELLVILAEVGEQLVATDAPTASRYLVVNSASERELSDLYRVVTYESFLHEIVDMSALWSASPFARRDSSFAPATGSEMMFGGGTNANVIKEVENPLTWLRQTLGTGISNVLVCGGPGSGKTALLASLLDSSWSNGPLFRFFIDLGDRDPDESLQSLIIRQLSPYFKVDKSHLFDVFIYIVRSGRALCIFDAFDENLGSGHDALLTLFLDLCEFFSPKSSTVIATRTPLLLDDPHLRQLIDNGARTSERLSRDLRIGGVDPSTLPAFHVLRLHQAEMPSIQASLTGLEDAIRGLSSEIDAVALRSTESLSGLLRNASDDYQDLMDIIGSSLFKRRCLPTAIEVIHFLRNRESAAASVQNGRFTLAHRTLAEVCAAMWYTKIRETRPAELVGLDVPSDLVRRIIYLLTPKPSTTTTSGRVSVWSGPSLVGPASRLVVRSLARPLRIASDPVTVGEYLNFLAEAAAELPSWLPSDTPSPGLAFPMVERLPIGRTTDLDQRALPITTISWWGATAYAHWAGGRLPTSLEWEIAARGADGRLFPWGDASDRHIANCADHWADKDVISYEEWKPLMDRGLIPVGGVTRPGHFKRGQAACGANDMGGNVWEWTSTLLQTGQAVVAGGSYDNPIRALRASERGTYQRNGRSNAVGFRVVFETEATR